jgi:membrane-anchored glycerophosphoryl diester phosphodiesterase (GDPDase)
VLQIFGTGMLTHVMGRSVVGQRTSVSESWALVKPQLLRLIAATVLVGLAVGAAIAVPLVPGAMLLTAGMTTLGAVFLLLGGLASMVLGVWITFRLILTTPVLALEDCGPVRAMKRSWRLVSGAFWRTLGIVLLGSIVAQAVGSIAASPFALLGGGSAEITSWSVFGLAIAGMITTLVALPFVAGVTALVYIDRRIRTENLAPVLQAASEQHA